jgi:hypothetical protein
MSTFGEVSWNDDVFGGDGKKNTNNKDLFLRLDEGSNEMRIVTQPFQYLVHKIKKDPNNPKDFGQKVSCSAAHGSCPACESGDKAKPRWLLGVISRKTGTYKILDISFAVFSQIRKYARNTARWGDPTKYDIDIVVDKNGSPMSYYSVQAISKEPLSAADQVIKDAADIDDLKRRVTPLTPEQVQKRMNKIMGLADDAAPVATAAASAKKAAPKAAAKTPAVSMTDDEDLGNSFPDYDGQPAS